MSGRLMGWATMLDQRIARVLSLKLNGREKRRVNSSHVDLYSNDDYVFCAVRVFL
jgi:hypothetical protein